jgi:hypothetical protein
MTAIANSLTLVCSSDLWSWIMHTPLIRYITDLEMHLLQP